MSKPYLSASRLKTLTEKCPRQYYYRYIEGIKTPPSGVATLGKGFHAAAEVNHKQKLETEQDLEEDVLTDAYAESFDEQVKDAKGEGTPVDWQDEKPGEVKDYGVEVVRTYRHALAPSIQPVEIEQEFTVSLGEEFPFTLHGYIDLVDAEGNIRDLKSKGRFPKQEDVDRDVQLSTYSLARRISTGKAETGISLDVIRRPEQLKTKYRPAEAKRFQVQRTNEQLRSHIKRIEEAAKMVQSGLFPPNTGGWWCSKKWCGYWEQVCPFGKKMQGGNR